MTFVNPGDAAIGDNVRLFRNAAGMSQAVLAERLSALNLGLTFTQQTILKIEKGSRPLRYIEGAAIAHVLDIHPDMLISVELSEAEITAHGLDRKLQDAHWQLIRAIFKFRDALAALGGHLDSSELTDEQIASAVQPWRRPMLDLTVSQIVEAILDPARASEFGLIPVTSRADADG